MGSHKILVVTPKPDLLGSLLFSLETEGYAVTGRSALPDVEWMQAQGFAACVVDQGALNRESHESVAFCIRAHPVILLAETPHAYLAEWVSQVVVTPDRGEALTTALRAALRRTAALS
jgi:DNA-binding response OmpR family regulator